MPRYQQILKDGTKFGHYVGNSPSTIARKMAKKIYAHNDEKGEKTFTFQFCQNRTLVDGGDKLYQYTATINTLKEPVKVQIGTSAPFFKYYKISVRQT
jgi:hypothetical protein